MVWVGGYVFDSINQEYIFKTLSFFNFGQYFINIVKTMLNNRLCALMIDRYEMKTLKIERGVYNGTRNSASEYQTRPKPNQSEYQ